MYENLSFLQKGLVMQHDGIAMHSGKIWADSTYYRKYPKVPQNLFGRNIWDI